MRDAGVGTLFLNVGTQLTSPQFTAARRTNRSVATSFYGNQKPSHACKRQSFTIPQVNLISPYNMLPRRPNPNHHIMLNLRRLLRSLHNHFKSPQSASSHGLKMLPPLLKMTNHSHGLPLKQKPKPFRASLTRQPPYAGLRPKRLAKRKRPPPSQRRTNKPGRPTPTASPHPVLPTANSTTST